jgi:hypothetical protein
MTAVVADHPATLRCPGTVTDAIGARRRLVRQDADSNVGPVSDLPSPSRMLTHWPTPGPMRHSDELHWGGVQLGGVYAELHRLQFDQPV